MKIPSSRILSMISIITLAATIHVEADATEPVQWTIESGGNGHYYQAFLVTNGITWQAASDAATDLDGYLATTTNAAENDFVYSLVSGDDSFWIIDFAGNGIGPWLGGLQPQGSPEPSGGWRWVTDEAFAYTLWATGEPNNNGGNEHRLNFHGGQKLKDKTWNDYPDAPSGNKPMVKGYVVEWSSTPPPRLAIRASEVEVCWTSLANATYRVEYRSDLTTNTWVTFSNCVPSAGFETCIYDKIQRGQPQRFYRVVVTNCVPGP